MTTTHQDFDLYLEKTAQHEFVAHVADGDGGRAGEHDFSLKMRENLQHLEAYQVLEGHRRGAAGRVHQIHRGDGQTDHRSK